MRAALAALAFALLPGGTHAQRDPEEAARDPAVQATARVIAAALAPSDYGAWAYHWDAVSIRVSRLMHWHLRQPDAIDRPPDAISERTGWIGEEGTLVGVTARGLDDRVLTLEFDVTGLYVLHLVEALRAEGVEVQFEGDDESNSYYWITPPGREGGRLTGTYMCTLLEARDVQQCHTSLTLAFEAP